MLVAQLTTGDLVVIALGIVIAAVLLYRIFRGEPRTRIARLGVFIERELLGIDEKDEQPTELAAAPVDDTLVLDDVGAYRCGAHTREDQDADPTKEGTP